MLVIPSWPLAEIAVLPIWTDHHAREVLHVLHIIITWLQLALLQLAKHKLSKYHFHEINAICSYL